MTTIFIALAIVSAVFGCYVKDGREVSNNGAESRSELHIAVGRYGR